MNKMILLLITIVLELNLFSQVIDRDSNTFFLVPISDNCGYVIPSDFEISSLDFIYFNNDAKYTNVKNDPTFKEIYDFYVDMLNTIKSKNDCVINIRTIDTRTYLHFISFGKEYKIAIDKGDKYTYVYIKKIYNNNSYSLMAKYTREFIPNCNLNKSYEYNYMAVESYFKKYTMPLLKFLAK